MSAEFVHLLMLLGVTCAPLPMVLALVAHDLAISPSSASLSDLSLAIMALWVVIESLAVTALGLAGHLFVRELVLCEATLLALGVGMMVSNRGAAVAHLCRVLFQGVIGLAQRSRTERWLLSLVGGMAALLFLQELGLPSDDYDTLAYQLPRVVEWYQRGTLWQQPVEWTGWINSYPFAWNTLFYLMMAPVGHDQFALLPNVIAWLMLGVASYGLARLAGGRPAGSLAGAVLVLLMPLSVINLHSAHNDLPFAAFFLSAVYFSIRAWRLLSGSPLLLAAACTGMMLGCKISGIGYLVLLIGLWLWLGLSVGRTHTLRWWDMLTGHPVLALLSVASIGVLGASWYLRNLYEVGNPLGFVQVSVVGRVIWEGPVGQAFVDQTNLLRNFRLSDPNHRAILMDAMREFPGWPGMMLVAGAVFSPFAVLYRREGRMVLLTVMGLCVATLYLYVAGPWSAKDWTDEISGWMGQQMRYSFPFWGLLAAAAGASLPASSIVGVAGAVGAIDALRHSALYSEVSHGRATLIFGFGVALVYLAGTAGPRSAARRALARLRSFRTAVPWRITIGIMLILLLMLPLSKATVIARSRRTGLQETRYGGIGRFVDQGLDRSIRVGFWSTNQSYLLYGKDLTRRLRYLALHEQPTWQDMARYVRAQPVDVVAVGPKFEPSQVWEWLDEHPEVFIRVHGENVLRDVLVYRVVRGPGQ